MLSAVLILFFLARSSSPLLIKPVNLLRKPGDRYVFLSVSNKSGFPQTFVPFAESRLNGKWERSSTPARSRTLATGDEIYYHTLLPNTGSVWRVATVITQSGAELAWHRQLRLK